MFASRKTAEVLREQLPRRQAAYRRVLFELVESEGRNAWLDGCILGLYFASPAEEGTEVGVHALMAARVTLVAQGLEEENPEAAALRYVGLDPKLVELESMRGAPPRLRCCSPIASHRSTFRSAWPSSAGCR